MPTSCTRLSQGRQKRTVAVAEQLAVDWVEAVSYLHASPGLCQPSPLASFLADCHVVGRIVMQQHR